MPVLYDPLSQGAYEENAAAKDSVGVGDIGKAGVSSSLGLMAQPFTAGQFAAERSDAPNAAKIFQGLSMLLHAGADNVNDSMSDAAKDAQKNPMSHPVGYMGLQVAGLAPAVAAFALFPEGAVASAIAGGAMQTGSVMDEVMAKTNAMSDEELAQQSPVFKHLTDEGMTSEQARAKLHTMQLSGGTLLASALTGAVGGGLLGKVIHGGSTAPSGAIKGALAGGAEGAIGFGAQSGQAAYAGQDADVVAGLRPNFDYGAIAHEALTGAITGGVFGGAMGGYRGLTAPKGEPKPGAAPKVEPLTTGVSEEQRTALNASQPEVAPPAPPAPPAAPAVDPVRAATADLDRVATEQQARKAPPEAPVEAPPVEAPPAPVADQGKQVIESKDQFKAQVGELADPENPRAAVLFPKGTKSADKPPMPDGMKSTSTKDGTFYYDPKRISPKEIYAASKDGSLNEVLSMGRTTKAEAMADAAKGAEPLTVVKRNEEGVPTVEHATTAKTMAEDVKAVQDKAVVGDTVEISTPQAVLAERQAATAAEAKPAATIEVVGGKRVIRTEDPALVKLREIKQAALDKADKEATKGHRGDFASEQNMKDAKARQKFARDMKAELKKGGEAADWAKEAAAVPSPGSGKPYTAANLAKLQEAHRKQLAFIETRRAAMPEKVQEAVTKSARKGKKDEVRRLSPDMEKELANIPEAERPSDIEARLAMAKSERTARLETEAVDKLIKGLSTAEQKRLAKLSPEELAEFGRLMRQQKGEANADKTGIDITARGSKSNKGERDLEVTKGIDREVPELRADEEHLETRGEDRQEAFDAESSADPDHVATGKLDEHSAYDVNGKRDSAAEEHEPTVVRDRPKAVLNEGEGYTAATVKDVKKETNPLASMAPKVEGKIKLTRRLRRAVENGEITLEEALGIKAHPEAHEIKSKSTLADSLSVARGLDSFGDVSRGVVTTVMSRLRKAVGDTEVQVVSQKAMDRLNPGEKAGSVHGYFDPEMNHIVVSERFVKEGKIDASLLTHEGVHALLDKGLARDTELRKTVDELRKYVQDMQDIKHNGFKDAHEFLAEALSNPKFQELLMSTPLPKEIAARLDMGTRTGTMWDGLLQGVHRYMQKVYQIFGGKPKEEYHALSAIMRIAERADVGGPNAPGPRRARSDYFEKLKEKADTTNGRGFLRMIQRATDSLTMLSQRAERLGGGFGEQARWVSELVQKADVSKSRHLERGGGGAEVVREGAALARSNPEKFSQLTDVMFKASEANLNLAKDGIVPNNNHLGKEATRGWQAKARLDNLLKEFRALPEDMQDWALKAVRFGNEERSAQSLGSIKAILKSAGIEEPGLAERIHSDGVTEADRAKFKTDKIVEHLDRVSDLKKREGWYVPFLRDGDHIAAGRVAVDVKENAFTRKVADNVVQFTDPKGGFSEGGARAAAEKFVGSHELSHIDTEKVWVDKNDHTKVLAAEDPNAVPAFRVTLQDKIFELHKSEKEALAASERMKSEGALDVYTDLLRQNPEGQWGGLMPSQYETMIGALKNREQFKKLPKAEQDALLQSMHEANIKLLPGGRIQKTSLQRRNVMGYSRDIVNSMGRYADMSAGYLTKLEYQPKIQEALKEMGQFIDQNRDGMTVRRRELLREMENRVHNAANPPSNSGTFGSVISRLLQVSSIDKLAGASFHVINATEPSVISVPIIGGRHGFGAAAAQMSRAYDLVGGLGALRAGVRDTVLAAKQASGFTDYLKLFKDNISKEVSPEHAQRLSDMLDHLADRNLFGSEAGMEIKRLAEPTGNMAGRTLDKIDLMSRQMGTAIEAINRSVTGITAYNLEFKRNGGNHEAAMRYAHDIVHDTMGNYASSNAAPIFNTPVGRAALQFKKYGQKIYYLLGKMIGGLHNDPEARKQFAGFMFTHGVVAGVLGWPLEPIKVGMMAANALGATTNTYDDFEQAIRSAVTGIVGQGAGEAITRGIPRALGVDLSGRMGLENLLTFSQPRSAKQQDLKAWLFDTIAGAPAGFVLQELAGAQELAGGNFGTAADKMIPLKFARDINRAATGFSEPKLNKSGREVMEPYTAGEASLRALGFTPSREAETREQRSALGGDVARYNQDRKALVDNYLKADPNNRGKQLIAIQKFNKGLPGDAQIKMDDLRTAEKRRKTEDENGTVVNGVRFSKRTEHLRSGMDTYNVGQ